MATDFYLDPLTDDLDLTSNKLRLTRNKQESSRQQIFIVLSCNKGEWFADIDFGIPYLENENNDLKGLSKGTKGLLDTLIKNAILTRENIVSIVSYNSTLDNLESKLTVEIKALTDSGEVIPVSIV